MQIGRVKEIYLAAAPGAAMEAVQSVNAVAGRGLEGDRYFLGAAPHESHVSSSQITLIEHEALLAAEAHLGVMLAPGISRRNLVIEGIHLASLLGRRFEVGEIVLEGIELAHPCAHLERLTVPGIVKALTNRGGLAARILSGGRLRVGDAVQPLDERA